MKIEIGKTYKFFLDKHRVCAIKIEQTANINVVCGPFLQRKFVRDLFNIDVTESIHFKGKVKEIMHGKNYVDIILHADTVELI